MCFYQYNNFKAKIVFVCFSLFYDIYNKYNFQILDDQSYSEQNAPNPE